MWPGTRGIVLFLLYLAVDRNDARTMSSRRQLDARLDTWAEIPFLMEEEGTAKLLWRRSLQVVELIGLEQTTS